MTRLKSEGYETFADIPPSLLLNSGSEDKRGSAIDDLTTVSLMLQADVFLAWGISEIDDIVEAERTKAGKPYCASDASSSSGAATVVVRMISQNERNRNEQCHLVLPAKVKHHCMRMVWMWEAIHCR